MKHYSWSVWEESSGRPCVLTEHEQPLQNAFWVDSHLTLVQGSFSYEIKRGEDYE
jgi:hypothetical protein